MWQEIKPQVSRSEEGCKLQPRWTLPQSPPWIIRCGGLPYSSDGKESACKTADLGSRPRFDPWVRKIPWGRNWQPTPIFLPEESHGQRSLAGCSPWSLKELDMTEQLTLTFLWASSFPTFSWVLYIMYWWAVSSNKLKSTIYSDFLSFYLTSLFCSRSPS